MIKRTFCKIFIGAIVAVFSLTNLSGDLYAQGRSDQAFERVAEVQERHTGKFLAKRGVVGTAVGLDENGGPVVLVLLENPGVGNIPHELEGVPVRTVVTGQFFARPKPPWAGGGNNNIDPTARFDRPVPIGISTGHPDITAGTIGCRVVDSEGNVYGLSNNHVYANSNKASVDDPVIQPGTYDGGSSPADDIGILVDFELMLFGGAPNTMDAAIASTTTGYLDNKTPSNGYGIPNSETVAASVGLPVQKYGRTTGWTKGTVDAVNASVNVNYGSPGVALFVNQIIITPGTFSDGGDSGSLIVTDNDNSNPVGLLFAGSSTHTIANPIDSVLTRFGVSVDGKNDGNPPPPPSGGTVSVSSVTYATEGGKAGDRHLKITVALEDETTAPVSGASVLIDLDRDGAQDASGTGTTGSDGTATFTRKNAPAGTYTTTVTDVTAAGMDWDGVTPPNSFTK